MGLERDRTGRLTAVRYMSERRDAWIGREGIGFGNGYVTYNAHWHDLRYPTQRYDYGPTRFAHFWSQLWQGFSRFLRGDYEEED